MTDSQTLTQHLIEIRRRLTYSILFLVLSFGICYFFVDQIYNFLLEPLAKVYGNDHSRRIIYTGVSEAFTTYLRLAFLSALFFSTPFFITQIYLFLAPGLYKKEKQFILSLFISAPLLFLIGSAFLYYFIFPSIFKFFVSFESPAGTMAIPIQLEARISEYLSMVVKLIFGFGIAFQLPVVIVILVKMGVVKVASLRSKRKYWILLIFVLAAVLTPPDVFSQISMALPMMLLYEIAILISARIR